MLGVFKMKGNIPRSNQKSTSATEKIQKEQSIEIISILYESFSLATDCRWSQGLQGGIPRDRGYKLPIYPSSNVRFNVPSSPRWTLVTANLGTSSLSESAESARRTNVPHFKGPVIDCHDDVRYRRAGRISPVRRYQDAKCARFYVTSAGLTTSNTEGGERVSSSLVAAIDLYTRQEDFVGAHGPFLLSRDKHR